MRDQIVWNVEKKNRKKNSGNFGKFPIGISVVLWYTAEKRFSKIIYSQFQMWHLLIQLTFDKMAKKLN